MRKLNKCSIEAKIMIGGACLCLGLLLFSFLAKAPLKYSLGVIFGGLFSILNFRLMQLTFKKALTMPPAQAQKYVQTRYFLRYLITGVVIYVAIINPYLDIIGVILGLIAIKVSVIFNNFKKNLSTNEGEKTQKAV